MWFVEGRGDTLITKIVCKLSATLIIRSFKMSPCGHAGWEALFTQMCSTRVGALELCKGAKHMFA